MKHDRLIIITLLVAFLVSGGCGTTKWTDTGRSATEQLLISDAMDRAVSELDFRALAGKTIFVDSTPVKKMTDCDYLVSCVRQHLLASGCIAMDDKAAADYILEVRAGAVGTDRHDLLYGIPSVSVPTVVPMSGIPSQIPEIPIIKKTDQRAIVKLSCFAYNQKTGRPIWQSGAIPQESDAKAVWVLGAGPFQRGTIYDGVEFAGNKLNMPLVDIYRPSEHAVSVADEAFFAEPKKQAPPEKQPETSVAADGEKKAGKPKEQAGNDKPAPVVPAGHAESPPGGISPPPSQPGAEKPPASPSPPPSGANRLPPPDADQTPPAAAPNDLAPALAELTLESEPGLLGDAAPGSETGATHLSPVLPLTLESPNPSAVLDGR